MPIITKYLDNTVTAHIVGEIDHHNAAHLRKEIDFAIEKHKPEELILDFDEVTFMDSSGIGLVMGRFKVTHEYGGKIIVANTSTQIKKVMRLAGLDKLASIE